MLGPFESRRSRAFPLLLKAPAATLSRMMADLLKDGEIEVGLYSALDLTFGPDRVRLPYVEELITVALENKGLAGSAAAMQLVDKLAGGQVRSSLEPAEIPAEVEPRSSRGRAEVEPRCSRRSSLGGGEGKRGLLRPRRHATRHVHDTPESTPRR